MKGNTFRLLLLNLAFFPLSLPADTVGLKNGDVIHGTVTEQTDTTITLDHASLGTITIPREQVSTVEIDAPPESGEAVAAESAQEKAPADGGLFHTGALVGWKRNLDIGLNGARGNSRNFNLHIGAKGKYEDENDRWLVDAAYDSASSEGDKSQNQAFAELDKDWMIRDTKWFYFAKGRYDWDEFKEWNQRVALSVGPGYQFVKNDVWDLIGRLGIGGNRTFGGTDREFTLEGLIGFSVGWKPTRKQSLNLKNNYYPSLRSIGDWRNSTMLDWKFDLDYYKGLHILLGLRNEYESMPDDGQQKDDFVYNFSLGWEL